MVASVDCGPASRVAMKSDNLRSVVRLGRRLVRCSSSADETAIVYCGWAEMEIRKEQYPDALQIMRGAISPKGKEGVAAAACNNAKVWALYLDLIESLGTADEVRGAYDDAMKRGRPQRRCASTTLSIWRRPLSSKSFRVFERSVDLFVYPQVKRSGSLTSKSSPHATAAQSWSVCATCTSRR